jgi:ubiquitin-like domain-containing CTD phosphatase 1
MVAVWSLLVPSPIETLMESVSILSLEAKWRGQVYSLTPLDLNTTTLYDVKLFISSQTHISISNIKLFGLTPATANGTTVSDHEIFLIQFQNKIKKNKLSVTVMGTPDEELQQMETHQKSSLESIGTTIFNDFGHNFTPATPEWHQLKEFTTNLEINFIHQPRHGYKLLVLDLDHTILDFSSKMEITPHEMKRPYMDYFLQEIYQHYDIAIWSQTHWKWLEIKLIELGLLTHSSYRICFVLDKSSMFRSGPQNQYIKPLHIIWSKFPTLWSKVNTLHVDDLDRNFALNPSNGILIEGFYRQGREGREGKEKKAKSTKDSEGKRRRVTSSSGGGDPSAETEDTELFLLTR